MIRKKFDDDGYMGTQHMGRGLALGDLDDDGDADFVFSNNVEPAAIVENTTEQTGLNVRVKLIGRTTNRDAVGSILTLKTSAGDFIRLTRGGASYLSQSDPRMYWSLPADTTINSLVIQWPDGQTQEIEDIPTTHALTVIQSNN